MSKRKGKREKKDSKKVKISIIISAIFFIIFICCVVFLVLNHHEKVEDKKIIEEVQEYEPVVPEEAPTKTSKMIKVEELQANNSEVKGWIEIENTSINFPILQGTDNNYYLTHDYKKDYSWYGSIFLKTESDINNVNSNLIIYGHNMGDNEMFHSLLEYRNKSFYDEHKTINITTENEERKYEIVSAFMSRVFYEDEKNVFRYYNCINFNNDSEYNDYINNVKKIQLYDTGVTANYGEQLITLITCEYSKENGRMVIVAKKISS